MPLAPWVGGAGVPPDATCGFRVHCWWTGGVAGTAPTPPPQQPIGGNYFDWWRNEWARIRSERDRKKKKKLPPKKQQLLEKLDDAILDLRAQAAEREVTEAYTRELMDEVLGFERFLSAAYAEQVTQAKIRQEIARVEAYMRELDDEESTILLAIH